MSTYNGNDGIYNLNTLSVKKSPMDYLKTRIKSGSWIAASGFVIVLLEVVLENLGKFEIPAPYDTIALIDLTATLSQITKWLNKGKQ